MKKLSLDDQQLISVDGGLSTSLLPPLLRLHLPSFAI
jgi:hypothetical protein